MFRICRVGPTPGRIYELSGADFSNGVRGDLTVSSILTPLNQLALAAELEALEARRPGGARTMKSCEESRRAHVVISVF